MLYNIIYGIFTLSVAILVLISYEKGLKKGMLLSMSKDEQSVNKAFDRKKSHLPRQTKEQREKIERYNRIINNIERYDGTSDGQKDID